MQNVACSAVRVGAAMGGGVRVLDVVQMLLVHLAVRVSTLVAVMRMFLVAVVDGVVGASPGMVQTTMGSRMTVRLLDR